MRLFHALVTLELSSWLRCWTFIQPTGLPFSPTIIVGRNVSLVQPQDLNWGKITHLNFATNNSDTDILKHLSIVWLTFHTFKPFNIKVQDMQHQQKIWPPSSILYDPTLSPWGYQTYCWLFPDHRSKTGKTCSPSSPTPSTPPGQNNGGEVSLGAGQAPLALDAF